MNWADRKFSLSKRVLITGSSTQKQNDDRRGHRNNDEDPTDFMASRYSHRALSAERSGSPTRRR
jgi:hypothetical protein